MAQSRTIFDGVEFDDQAAELLMEAAARCRCPPRELIASIVKDVLIDDACAHGSDMPPRNKMN